MDDNEKIDVFRKSQDYKDICYMIDHVPLKERISCLRSLGYRIGFTISKNETIEKNIIFGKHGELRMQVTPKIETENLYTCVIVE